MRVPIEAALAAYGDYLLRYGHHPLKMRVPIEAAANLQEKGHAAAPSPSENEGPY